MSNIYRLIILLPFFMLGCAPKVIEENKVTQKIESLNMDEWSRKYQVRFLKKKMIFPYVRFLLYMIPKY